MEDYGEEDPDYSGSGEEDAGETVYVMPISDLRNLLGATKPRGARETIFLRNFTPQHR